MASKDPFGDLALAGGLVKKSMAEQKASSMARQTPPTPPKPAADGAAGSPAVAGYLHSAAARPSPPKGSMGTSSKNSSTGSLAGLVDDPFAGLGGISKPAPMAAQRPPVSPSPTQQRAEQPAPAQQLPAAASGPTPSASPSPVPSTFDLEDMFGPAGRTQQQMQPSKPTAVAIDHDDPFAAFGGVEGAAAAVPATPTPPTSLPVSPQPQQQQQQHCTDTGSRAPARLTATDAQLREQTAAAAASMSSTSTGSSSAAAFSNGVPAPYLHRMQQEQQQQQRQQQQQQQQHHRQQYQPNHVAASEEGPRSELPGSFSGLAYEERYGAAEQQRYGEYGYQPDRADSFGEFAAASSGSGTNRTWGGLFRTAAKTAAVLGKKGLKAAQAGLAQLETALEGMDKTAAGHADSSSFHSSHHHQNHIDNSQQQQPPYEDDLPAERVLSIAIHISEMPSHKQPDALARLPVAVRRKVMALLQEQAVIQGEELRNARGVINTTKYVVDEAAPQAAAAAAAVEAGTARPASSSTGGSSSSRPTSTPEPAVSVAVAVPKVVVYDDLLGMSGTVARSSASRTSAAAAPPPSTTQAVPPAAHGRMRSVADMDEFFSGGGAPVAADPGRSVPSKAASPAVASRSTAPAGGLNRVLSGSDGQLADLLGGGGAAAGGAAGRAAAAHKSSSMTNLGGLEALAGPVDVSGHQDLYDDGSSQPGDGDEPELRRQLRAARAAEKHAKMKAALAEKQAKEAEEAQRREQQQAHKLAHRERIEAWRNKNKGNVRGLLSSLQTVLWDDSGWKPIGMADLLEPAQVRKAWMKANLLVHPDKVRQRNGGDEQVAIADMIFDALKEAWGQFKG